LNRELLLQSAIAKAEQFYDEQFNGGDGNSDDETLNRLAALSPVEYERVRKDEAERLGFRASVLDKLVEGKRLLLKPSESDNSLQGKAIKLADVELWPEAVNGAEVLDAIAGRFKRYVVQSDEAADTVALWCAHTHCYKVFQCSPRL